MTEGARADILIVDDDPVARELLRSLLAEAGYSCLVAGDAVEARVRLAEGPFSVLVCDVQLPGESGLELARDLLRTGREDTAVVMVTVDGDVSVAESAIALGAHGWITKPVRPVELLTSVASAVRRRRLDMDLRERVDALERRLERQAEELREAVRRLEVTAGELDLSQGETIHRLARAVALRSHETSGHIERVGRYAELLARRIELEPADREAVSRASALHDIGKVAVSDRVLLKPGALSDDERREMQRHPELGHYVLSGTGSDIFELGATIALSHHEWADGSGYPHGLSKDEIPLAGRITAVADVFDALTHDRVYRGAFEPFEAAEIMRGERDRHFDRDLLDPFLEALPEVIEIGDLAQRD
jgi:putative two-component system response regulator